jgi:hypothetical protein
MTYEIAMISTSFEFLEQLFIEEAKKNVCLRRGISAQEPIDWEQLENKNEINAISSAIAVSIKKDIFPYMMKTTLAKFFENLHPYEQKLLRKIPTQRINALCQSAVEIANQGKAEESAFMPNKSPFFMRHFTEFYERTFLQFKRDGDNFYVDPVEFLFERFLDIKNIGTEHFKVPGVVIEARRPEQGARQAEDVCTLYSRYRTSLNELLGKCTQAEPDRRAKLDRNQQGLELPKVRDNNDIFASLFDFFEPRPVYDIKGYSQTEFYRKEELDKVVLLYTQARFPFTLNNESGLIKQNVLRLIIKGTRSMQHHFSLIARLFKTGIKSLSLIFGKECFIMSNFWLK